MSYRARHAIPDLGVGVGFRVPHHARVLDERPPMGWFEVISENFMVAGGRPLENLARLKDSYPVVPHGVSLAVGSVEPLDTDHLTRLGALVDRLDPPWVSDHLCWGRAPGLHLHDLLPLPYTRASQVVVFRGPSALQCLDLEQDAYALLDELARGTPLGDACERVAASSGATEVVFQVKVGAWFQQWTTLGLISGVELAR